MTNDKILSGVVLDEEIEALRRCTDRTGVDEFYPSDSEPGEIANVNRGRPAIDSETIQLIRRMCRANPLWGAPRIHGELLKLGIVVCETTVAKYMIMRRGSPSQAWKTFLENHLKETIALAYECYGASDG